jgi:hypothetical protein
VPVAAPALIAAAFVAFFVPGPGEAAGGMLLFAAMAVCAATLAGDARTASSAKLAEWPTAS